MNDLTDIKFFLASLIRPIVKEAFRDEVKSLPLSSSQPADDVLTIEQAADLLNLSVATVYGMVAARRIPFSKPTGAKLYFLHSELIAWLKSHRTATTSEQAEQYEKARTDQNGGSRRKSTAKSAQGGATV
jgi:excisionase family DNA binding protein